MTKREKYLDKLEAQLRDWNEQIDELQTKADHQSREVKARVVRQLDELKDRRAGLKGRLDRIKGSGEDTFEKIKDDSEKLWRDVKNGLINIRSKIIN